jgi:hypothetical protein
VLAKVAQDAGHAPPLELALQRHAKVVVGLRPAHERLLLIRAQLAASRAELDDAEWPEQ